MTVFKLWILYFCCMVFSVKSDDRAFVLHPCTVYTPWKKCITAEFVVMDSSNTNMKLHWIGKETGCHLKMKPFKRLTCFLATRVYTHKVVINVLIQSHRMEDD